MFSNIHKHVQCLFNDNDDNDDNDFLSRSLYVLILILLCMYTIHVLQLRGSPFSTPSLQKLYTIHVLQLRSSSFSTPSLQKLYTIHVLQPRGSSFSTPSLQKLYTIRRVVAQGFPFLHSQSVEAVHYTMCCSSGVPLSPLPACRSCTLYHVLQLRGSSFSTPSL